jgi:hypothetical protein
VCNKGKEKQKLRVEKRKHTRSLEKKKKERDRRDRRRRRRRRVVHLYNIYIDGDPGIRRNTETVSDRIFPINGRKSSYFSCYAPEDDLK